MSPGSTSVVDGAPYFLEANPLPGLSPTSGDLVLLSAEIGLSHIDLIALIFQAVRVIDFGCPSTKSVRSRHDQRFAALQRAAVANRSPGL